MTKRIYILLFLTFISVAAVFSQSYKLQMSDSRIDCYLELYPNKTFIVKMSYRGAADLMMSNIFSFGDYRVGESGIYTLTDNTHAYSMTLETASEKVLFVKKSFEWMENNYFVMSAPKPITPADITANFLKAEEVAAFREKNSAPTCPATIEDGVYTSSIDGYSLRLSNNGVYTMSYFSLPVSKGKWTVEKNILVLFDTNVNAKFYAIVLKDGSLRSALLPGEFSAAVFKE